MSGNPRAPFVLAAEPGGDKAQPFGAMDMTIKDDVRFSGATKCTPFRAFKAKFGYPPRHLRMPS